MDTPFGDFDAYLRLPRLSGLTLSADGSRLVTTVSTLNAKANGFRSALWEVDPTGERPAHRLTRSRKGESSAVFTDAGDLLFTSARPDPDSDQDDDAPAALWRLPAAGGEASVIGSRLGGFESVRTHGTVVLASADRLTRCDLAAEEALRKDRKEKKVSAMLHAGYPIRHWDSDTGPGVAHLLRATITDDPRAGEAPDRLAFTDVTPHLGAHELSHYDLSADGAFAVYTHYRMVAGADRRARLHLLDLVTGESRVLLDPGEAEAGRPVISPDNRLVAYVHENITTAKIAPHVELRVLDLATGESRRIAIQWDRWAVDLRWTPDSTGLVLTADEDGRCPIFFLDLGTDQVSRVTSDDAAFSELRVSPDGRTLYALRASYRSPAEVVRVDLAAALASGEPVAASPLPGPARGPELPGTLTEVECAATDGSRIRGWLALPAGASAERPAPLLLWIHGGPLNSWNAWSWRWCPWLLVAQGYAVLLPDPALSTGYGEAFVARGWGRWGAAPYTDLLSITDAVEARADIDESRTAAMGGSFGGYMANWIAGHTNRFDAIVTHASLWALDQFGPTTDHAYFWSREMDVEMSSQFSPHASVTEIDTPVLVIHGDNDYRVPIGEGLRLWWELLSQSKGAIDDDGRTPHRFLYFPDENHWVLTPQHAKLWYATVIAFLAEHVLGETREYPQLLG